jgi:hypothetical protein
MTTADEMKMGGSHYTHCVRPVCSKMGGHYPHCRCPLCGKMGGHYAHFDCPVCGKMGREHHIHIPSAQNAAKAVSRR